MSHLEDARKLIEPLAVKKKAKLLFGNGAWKTYPLREAGLPEVEMHDGPLGLRIPEKKGGDTVPAVCYPSPALLACSFSETLLSKVGIMMGREALLHGTDLLLAPGINIKRNPLCGRNFEYLSEDPVVSGKLGAAFVKGIQSTGVGAVVKHFALNNQEFRRFTYSAEVDERALREIYLLPFEIAVKDSEPWGVMSSYNKVNGVQMSSNAHLVKDILKGEWGYEGAVMSDWGATLDPINDHRDGLDLEMPGLDKKRLKGLMEAVEEKRLSEETINEAASRVATLALRKLERTENPRAWNIGMGRSAARTAAEESIVLAKNERDFFPWKSYRDVAVIGAIAKEPRYQGAGSSHVHPTKLRSFLDVAKLPDHKPVAFAPGYAFERDADSKALRDEAVALAAGKRKVLLFLGLPDGAESEGYDRKDMSLPEEEIELFNAIREVNDNIAVVVCTGAPVELPFASSCRAIFLAYLSGEAGMEALDHLIRGEAVPSGRVAETWPLSYGDVPSSSYFPGAYDRSLYKESIFVGYRYYETASEPVLFPFGHGLSYAKFKYGRLTLSKKEIGPGEKLTVSFELTNLSNFPAREVVLLFVGKKANSKARPKRELKAFASVKLKAKETKEVRLELSYRDFAFYSEVKEGWVSEGGSFNVELMKNASRPLSSVSVKVTPSEKLPPLRKEAAPYLNFVKTSYLDVSDAAFSAYRGVIHEVEQIPTRFDSSSTFNDIKDTWIGKIIERKMRKLTMSKSERRQGVLSGFYRMAMEQPIRSASAMGYSKNFIDGIVHLANGEFWRGVKTMLGK